jgi:hypothetical protein
MRRVEAWGWIEMRLGKEDEGEMNVLCCFVRCNQARSSLKQAEIGMRRGWKVEGERSHLLLAKRRLLCSEGKSLEYRWIDV